MNHKRDDSLGLVSLPEGESLCVGLSDPHGLTEGFDDMEFVSVWSWDRSHPSTVSTFLYFIEATDQDRIKIGISKNPYKRVEQLQTGSPHRLFLLGVCKGNYQDEAVLHRMYKHLRVSGEWFEATLELRGGIEKILHRD